MRMAYAFLVFTTFHLYMLRWGVRSYWREVYVTLGK
jgi:hypothetical protein